MRLFTFKVPDDFNLCLQGDAHKYTKAHSADGYKLLFDSVNSEFEGVPASKNYVVDFGDFADLIPHSHRYFDPKVQSSSPLEQIERIVEDYEPIAHALLFMLDSTHSDFLKEIGNVTEFVCHRLEEKYKPYRRGGLFATFTAKADFRSIDNTRIFKLYGTHGSKGIWSRAGHQIRRKANKTMALVEYLQEQATDCAVMARAHTHQLIVQEPLPKLCMWDDGENLYSFYPDPTEYHGLKNIPEEMRWYISTGGFLRTQILGASTYGEKREYNPMDLGFAVCMVRDRKIAGVKKVVL